MPEAVLAAVVFVLLAVALAVGAVRLGMLLGGIMGRRLDAHDEEEPREPGR